MKNLKYKTIKRWFDLLKILENRKILEIKRTRCVQMFDWEYMSV